MDSNIKPTRTPQESADALTRALEDNTKALNRVKRNFRWTLLSVVILTLSLALSLKFNYDGNVGRCESGNELRSELDVKFQGLADILIAAGTGERPAGRAVIEILEEDLPPRDCSDIDWLGH